MQRIVRAFPILPGKEKLLREVTEALAGKMAESACAFYESLGTMHESWYLQETPHGPQVIVLTIVDDIDQRAPLYAASNDAFHLWFKAQVKELTGVDPSQTPKGPPTEQIFSWPKTN